MLPDFVQRLHEGWQQSKTGESLASRTPSVFLPPGTTWHINCVRYKRIDTFPERRVVVMKLPTVSIGSHRVSRLIIGSGPYSGISHHSPAKSREMEDYYTAAQIMADLREAERCGINTVLARTDRHIMRALNEYRNAGGKIQWIAQTAKGNEHTNLMDHIRLIARYQPIAIYHHGGTTDRLYDEGKLDSLHDALALIRDLGFAAGIGTHDPQILKYCYHEDYDVDFYVCALYNHTRRREMYLSADRDAAIVAIQAVHLPVIAIKVLAAGRSEPVSAFQFALEGIKPIDAIAVGMYTKGRSDLISDNVTMVASLLEERRDTLGQSAVPPVSSSDELSQG